MDYCSFWAETTFGPAVDLCRRPFDFTLRFEDIFFQLVSSCVFIVASATRLGVILRRPVVVKTGALHSAKLVSATTLAQKPPILPCPHSPRTTGLSRCLLCTGACRPGHRVQTSWSNHKHIYSGSGYVSCGMSLPGYPLALRTWPFPPSIVPHIAVFGHYGGPPSRHGSNLLAHGTSFCPGVTRTRSPACPDCAHRAGGM